MYVPRDTQNLIKARQYGSYNTNITQEENGQINCHLALLQISVQVHCMLIVEVSCPFDMGHGGLTLYWVDSLLILHPAVGRQLSDGSHL